MESHQEGRRGRGSGWGTLRQGRRQVREREAPFKRRLGAKELGVRRGRQLGGLSCVVVSSHVLEWNGHKYLGLKGALMVSEARWLRRPLSHLECEQHPGTYTPCIAGVKLEGIVQGAVSHRGRLVRDAEAKVPEIKGLEVKEAESLPHSHLCPSENSAQLFCPRSRRSIWPCTEVASSANPSSLFGDGG